MDNKYELVDVVEDVCKNGYNVGVFSARIFYRVSGLFTLNTIMNQYLTDRFIQRLEYFTFEHDKLTPEVKERFYRELEGDSSKLNYLYEFIEKARTSTYDIHAKILAKLSTNLIQNGNLTYLESSLLVNLNQLTDFDLKFFSEFNISIDPNNVDSSIHYMCEITDEDKYNCVLKLEKLGYLNISNQERREKKIGGVFLNDLSISLMQILKDINIDI